MGNALMDALQGASNAAAANVSAPIDGIAWLLRKAGIPVPASAFGGSDWMAQQGLTRRPQNALAGIIGESLGGALPIAAVAKAPQIARGLLALEEQLPTASRGALGAANQVGAVGVKPGSIATDLEKQFPGLSLRVMEDKSSLTIGKIVLPKELRGQGIGSNVMRDILDYADKTGKRVNLSPSADFGGNVNRLKDYYKRFGFVENKGANKDFAISESMYRNARNGEPLK